MRLWAKNPEAYKRCRSFSDFWESYAQVFSLETRQQVEKKTGEVAHMEASALRQHLAR